MRPPKDIDLGLALLHNRAIPGVPLTLTDIAAWCGCTMGGVWIIENRALQKLRRALHLRGNSELQELIDAIK
jgi:hypothetical protein